MAAAVVVVVEEEVVVVVAVVVRKRDRRPRTGREEELQKAILPYEIRMGEWLGDKG